MASLQNEQIDQSYQGLIKTADNTAAKPFPPAKLQYGDGTDTPIAIGEGPAGSGLGDMIEITSGTGTNTGILINGTGVVVNDLNNISPNANGLTIANGATATTINFGFAFPGAPATTVDFSAATVTGLPSGGGAQAPAAIGASAMKGYIPYNNSTTQGYKTNQMLSGYGLASAGSGNDKAYWQIFALAEGETLSSLVLSVQTAVAATTAQVAIYDTDVDSDGRLYVNDQLSDLGTVDTSTTGDKVINLATPFTMPSGKVNGQVAIVVFRSDNAVAFKGWSQSVFSGWGGAQVGGIFYRSMSPHVNPGVSPGTALPSNIGSIGDGRAYSASTSNPLMVLYRN